MTARAGAVKNAVVTGGGSGIGQAVAHRLRADGIMSRTLISIRRTRVAYVADVTDRARLIQH